MNNPLLNPGVGTFFWMIFSFGILVFILGKWGWPMLLDALKKREEAIAEALKAADRAKQEMASLTAHNEELMLEARKERDEMLHNARLASEEIKEKARQQALEETDRMLAKARESIENERLKAIHDIKNLIATLSIDIAQKVIQSELSDKEKSDAIIRRELENAHLN